MMPALRHLFGITETDFDLMSRNERKEYVDRIGEMMRAINAGETDRAHAWVLPWAKK